MDNDIRITLRNYLEHKDYDSYSNILKKEITNLFIKEVQKKNPYFLYSTLVELLEEAQNCLSEYQIEILRKFYMLQKEEYKAEVVAYKLMEIYEKLFKN